MAKLQIFVLAAVLVQGYCVSLSTLPAAVPETRPLPLPEAESVEVPPCVLYVKLLLQSIIDKLSDLPVVERPTPEILPEEEDDILVPETPDVEEEDPVVPEVAANPCVACFEYINTLIVSAKKTVANRQQ